MDGTNEKSSLNKLMCYNVYALHHAFSRFYQAAFGDTGFTYPKFIILLALDDSGPISLGDLSAKIGLEANSISPLVKKMSAFGLIERVRDPKDERRILLTLLPYGQKVLSEARKVVSDGWEALGLDDQQVAGINASLIDLRSRVEILEPKGKMSIPKKEEE